MLVAIIYTGEARTIESTIQLFKQNVVLNDNYHVYGVVQSSQDQHETIIRETLGDNIKNLEWFDKDNSEWITIREELLQNMMLDERWKNYLRTSGSMIEYYQLYVAYQSLEKYEMEHEMKYDFVLRFRTDTVIKDVIRFDDIFKKDYVTYIVNQIKDTFNIDHTSEQFLHVFMNTFYNEKRIGYELKYQIKTEFKLGSTIDDLLDYLKHGNYMVSLRKNVIYFVRRDLMTQLHLLGITYGKYTDPDYYWFNSESQLENICESLHIDKYNSTTQLEDESLYMYNPIHYYEQEQLKENEYSFFIKRH
jgi:hypothetical protein